METKPFAPVSAIKSEQDGHFNLMSHDGLNKLEFFTAAALTGILANPDIKDGFVTVTKGQQLPLAEAAVKFAKDQIDAINKFRPKDPNEV